MFQTMYSPTSSIYTNALCYDIFVRHIIPFSLSETAKKTDIYFHAIFSFIMSDTITIFDTRDPCKVYMSVR